MSLTFRLERSGNIVRIGGDLGIEDVRKVLAALHEAINVRGHQDCTIDFRDCSVAFSGAVLPICAAVMLYRQQKDVDFNVFLPEYDKTYRLFTNAGWRTS